MQGFFVSNLHVFVPAIAVMMLSILNCRNAKFPTFYFPFLFVRYAYKHRDSRPEAKQFVLLMVVYIAISTIWAAVFSWLIYHYAVAIVQAGYDYFDIQKQSHAGFLTCTMLTILLYLSTFLKVEKELDKYIDQSTARKYENSIVNVHEMLTMRKPSTQGQDDPVKKLMAAMKLDDDKQLADLLSLKDLNGASRENKKESYSSIFLMLNVLTLLLYFTLIKLRSEVYRQSDTLVRCFSTEILGCVGHNRICAFLVSGDTAPIKSIVNEIKEHVDLSDTNKRFENAQIALKIMIAQLGYYKTQHILNDYVTTAGCTENEKNDGIQSRCDRTIVAMREGRAKLLVHGKSHKVHILELSDDKNGLFVSLPRYIKSNSEVRFANWNNVRLDLDLSGRWEVRHSDAKLLNNTVISGLGLRRSA